MKLTLAIMDYFLVVMYVLIAKNNEGKSRKLYVACAVLWLMCGIINTLAFLSGL